MTWWVIKNNIKKYDLIVFYGAECFMVLYFLKNILKVKTPILLHSNGLELWVADLSNKAELVQKEKWYHFNLSKYYNYSYKKVNALLTVSKEQYNYAIDVLKLNKDKVFYNNLALPNLYFESKKEIEKQNIITYCGGWLSRKGVFTMAKALETVLIRYPDYKFRLIGVGKQFDLKEHFSQAIIPSIELIPFVSDKEALMNLYKESKIFLFPSSIESFGLVVAEAMYCGCATITGPTGYAAELKNGEEAIVLEQITEETIIQALNSLLTDDNLRGIISKKGKLKASKLTWDNFNLKLETLIKNIK
jgi:glycosyltransferase involved in cell wall biosynthesis